MNQRRNLLLAISAIATVFGVMLVTHGKRAERREEVTVGAEVPLDPSAKVVVAGVYVNQIHEFSLHEDSFTVDFYLWFRWKDPDLKPYESFSVVDGRIESRTDAVVRELPDGERHAYTRVVAKITRFFDVTDYPLDNHQLAIIVEEEDLEAQKLRYVADTENSAASPSILSRGASPGDFACYAAVAPLITVADQRIITALAHAAPPHAPRPAARSFGPGSESDSDSDSGSRASDPHLRGRRHPA